MFKTIRFRFAIPVLVLASLVFSGCTAARPEGGSGLYLQATKVEKILQADLAAGEDTLYVRFPQPNGPAAKAGLRQQDLIKRVDGVQVDSIQDIARILKKFEPGDTVSIEAYRGRFKKGILKFDVVLDKPYKLDMALCLSSDEVFSNCKYWNGRMYWSLQRPHVWHEYELPYYTIYKTVYPPFARIVDNHVRGWINCRLVLPTLGDAALVHPDLCLPPRSGYPQTQITLRDRHRMQHYTYAQTIGSTTVWCRPDSLLYYKIHDLKDPKGRSYSPPERMFILEIHLSEPSLASAPYRSLLLATRKYELSYDDWNRFYPDKTVVFIDNRLWSPNLNMQAGKYEFTERVLTAPEALQLEPFQHLPVQDLTNYLLTWKNHQLDTILRTSKTEQLRDYVTLAERTILEAVQRASREKNLAQQIVEQGGSRAGIHRDEALLYTSRSEVLKPILAAMKRELANRQK